MSLESPRQPEQPDKIFSESEMQVVEQEIVAQLEAIDKKYGNPYHNAEHSKAVLDRVKQLISALSLDAGEGQMLRLAALFHDYDHPGKKTEGESLEVKSANDAEIYAAAKGLSDTQRAKLRGLIMATDGRELTTDYERLLTIADGGDWTGTPKEWMTSRNALFEEVKKSDPDRYQKKVERIGIKAYLTNLLKNGPEKQLQREKWQQPEWCDAVIKLWGDKLTEKKDLIAKM